MKISMSVLVVALDTLVGSLSIVDGGRLFKFDKETREKAMAVFVKIINEINADVEVTQ